MKTWKLCSDVYTSAHFLCCCIINLQEYPKKAVLSSREASGLLTKNSCMRVMHYVIFMHSHMISICTSIWYMCNCLTFFVYFLSLKMLIENKLFKCCSSLGKEENRQNKQSERCNGVRGIKWINTKGQ